MSSELYVPYRTLPYSLARRLTVGLRTARQHAGPLFSRERVLLLLLLPLLLRLLLPPAAPSASTRPPIRGELHRLLAVATKLTLPARVDSRLQADTARSVGAGPGLGWVGWLAGWLVPG